MGYVVFTGKAPSGLVFEQIIGYLNSWVDQGLIKDSRASEIDKTEDLDILFEGDTGLKKVLEEKDFNKGLVIRAKLSKHNDFSVDVAKAFCDRYELQYK